MLFARLLSERAAPCEPDAFITAQCGFLCGSSASNGCSLHREGIHGRHAVISDAWQRHTMYAYRWTAAVSSSRRCSADQLPAKPTLTYMKCFLAIWLLLFLPDLKGTDPSSVGTMTVCWSWPPSAPCATTPRWTTTRSFAFTVRLSYNSEPFNIFYGKTLMVFIGMYGEGQHKVVQSLKLKKNCTWF